MAMAPPPSPHEGKPILIREVWAENLDSEFKLIGSIVDDFPFIAMDTEFPGTLVRNIGEVHFRDSSTPQHLYRFLRANIEVMKLIQLGVTFSDSDGNLPDLATSFSYIWQFNFSDFDVDRDRRSPTSIDLLRKQGIDFEKNKTCGVDSVKFAELMMSSGMVCNEFVTWITFHGNYDFGLLIKILRQRELPEELSDFMDLYKAYFGLQVYDVKCLIRRCDGIYGGLDLVATGLGLVREVGISHQAGSDSLLTCRAFHRIISHYFNHGGFKLDNYAGELPMLGASQ